MGGDKAHDSEAKLRELYRWVYARDPDAEELKIGLAHLEKHKDNPKVAFEDITWADDQHERVLVQSLTVFAVRGHACG